MKKLLLFAFVFGLYSSLCAQQYRLVWPKDAYVSATDTINFKWSAVTGALSYDILIATDAAFSATVTASQQGIAATGVQKTLPFDFTYYWKVRANTSQGPQAWSYYRSFTVFRPSQIPGLVMWFDAGKNIVGSLGGGLGYVSQWTDLSPSSIVASQSVSSKQPYAQVAPAIRNKPVVTFFGDPNTPNLLSFPTVSVSDFTSFILRDYRNNSNAIQYVLAGPGTGIFSESDFYQVGHGIYNSGNDTYYATTTNDLALDYSIYTNEPDSIFRNGVQPLIGGVSGNVVGQTFSFNTMGTRPDIQQFAFLGHMAEILLYNNKLDANTRKIVEGYLRYKYSQPVDLGPDTFFNKFCVSVTLNATPGLSSYLWSTGATTSSINVTSLGKYSVVATDVFGYKSYDTVEVRPQIQFNQLASSYHLCAGNSIIWDTGYPSTGFQYTWSTGESTPSIVINNSGSYFVKIKDAFNCYLYSDTVHVVIDSFSYYTMGADTALCSGNQLNFGAAGPISSIIWSNGDTTTTPTITTAGNYSVTATNSIGCVNTSTIHVSIKGTAPDVNYYNSPLCVSDTVLFVDSTTSSTGNAIVSWFWNFGDGDTSILQNPVHSFSVAGQYPVTLTAYTDSGCSNTILKTLSAYLKPHADFQSNIICALSETQFLDISSPASSIAHWKWHAGTDSSLAKNPKFAFQVPGKYEISLVATNINGCSDYASDTIEVFAPLSANLAYQNICLGDSTSFADITPSLSIVSWLWYTGDNYYSSKKNFKHKFAAAGTYNVTLRVQNAIGCIDTTSRDVSVYHLPVAAFGSQAICENQTATLFDSSHVFETVNSSRWNIDGDFYTGSSAQHFFPDTGNYPVSLVVTSQSGCKDSVSHFVHVNSNPLAAFTFVPLYGDAPLTATFTNGSENAASYFWSFGDGFTDVAENPSHTYLSNDTFQIKLVATSDFGCQDSAVKSITVVHTDLDVSVDYITSDPAPQADGTVLVPVTVGLSNVGTRLITTLKLYATIGSGGVISEGWDTLIQSGSQRQYEFNAHFVVAAASANTYVCVTAKSVNNGETETRTDNNSACNSLNGTLQLIGPSPNPARGNAYLGLIMPKAGKVTIGITDLMGRSVVSDVELDLPIGRSDYDVPVKLLRAGEYFIQVKHNDDKLLKKLVVH